MNTSLEELALHVKSYHHHGDGTPGAIGEYALYPCCAMILIENSLAIEKQLGWPYSGPDDRESERNVVLQNRLHEQGMVLADAQRRLQHFSLEVEALRKGTVVARATSDYILKILGDDEWWEELSLHVSIRAELQEGLELAIKEACEADMEKTVHEKAERLGLTVKEDDTGWWVYSCGDPWRGVFEHEHLAWEYIRDIEIPPNG